MTRGDSLDFRGEALVVMHAAKPAAQSGRCNLIWSLNSSGNRVWIGLRLNVLQIFTAIKLAQSRRGWPRDLDSGSVDASGIAAGHFSGIRTWQGACSFDQKINSGSGVFGVGAQIPRAFGSPFGCCASLRSEIVIRPQKPGSADIALCSRTKS